MPRRKGQSYPQMNEHKASGRAYVLLPRPGGERDFHYLGAWGSPEAQREYDRVIARLAASPNRSPLLGDKTSDDLSLNELVLAYLTFAEGYYVGEDGRPTSMVERAKYTARKPVELFGTEPAAEFGPRALKVVMDAWVKEGLTRKYVNQQAQQVKGIFRWAVGEELLPSSCFERLKAVPGLRQGRTAAPDRPRVKPANQGEVDRVLPQLRPAVAAIVRLMVHSGARCGELVKLRPCDIDRTEDVWTFQPNKHKGTWRGKARVIYFGKVCREVLMPYLAKAEGPEAYLFSPAREEAERNALRSAERKTPLYPSHATNNKNRKSKKPTRPPGERYKTPSVRRCVQRACEKAGVPEFTPHRLRHLAGTLVRSEFGVDVARAMLGHSLASVTEICSKEVDKELAMKAARKLG